MKLEHGFYINDGNRLISFFILFLIIYVNQFYTFKSWC